MKLSTQKKHRFSLNPQDDLLKLLVTAWGLVMTICVGGLMESPKPLANSIHFFVFAAIGVAGLCDLIFIIARSVGPHRNRRAAVIGISVLVVLTLIESVVISRL